MKSVVQLILAAFFAMALSACGGSDNTAGDGEVSTTAKAARFGDELGKGCDLLTADMVASTFGVPADALKQMKAMGCHYSWDDDANELQASIMMIRAHESGLAAKSWFASATKSRSAEEMQAEMAKVSERMEASEELDTKAKKSMAKSFLKSAGSKAVTFEDVAGVGDEARVNADGNVYVRVDNLTFMVGAYYGPVAPPADIKGMRDVKEMMAAAMQHSENWKLKTLSQRKQDAAKLAGVIVAEL